MEIETGQMATAQVAGSSQQLVELCRRIWEQKATVDAMNATVAVESDKLTKLKAEALKQFEALGTTKQHLPGFGTIAIRSTQSIQVPKNPDDWKKVFEYIRSTKGEDALAGMVGIHSGTLNSFYNAESDAQAEAGNFRWALPGVGEPKEFKQLSLTKERG